MRDLGCSQLSTEAPHLVRKPLRWASRSPGARAAGGHWIDIRLAPVAQEGSRISQVRRYKPTVEQPVRRQVP
jgi:hypothetical protein